MSEKSAGNSYGDYGPSFINTITTTTTLTLHTPTTMCITTPSMTSPIISPLQTSSNIYIQNLPSTPSGILSPASVACPETPEYHTNDELSTQWQSVKKRGSQKRFRENETNQSRQINKRSNANYNANNNSTTPTSNRFTSLNIEDVQSEETVAQNTENNLEHKPPPIYIQDVVDYPAMLQTIETTLQRKEFICKTLSNNKIKINTSTINAYRKLNHLLKQNNIAFYTYQPREERSYRVVIKNIHQSVPTQDIKEALQELGFDIRSVTNIRSWKTKEPLPLFFVDQEPNENNKNIYKINHLLNTKILVEAPRKKKEIPQCTRCQEYGHTKSYCNKPFYCVKCANNHPTNVCQKLKDLPATCILCGGPHPANYKGCTVYRDLQKSRGKPFNYIRTNQENNTEKPRLSKEINSNISYAQVTKNSFNNDTTINSEDISLSQFLHKFETMFSQLMSQNSIIINMLSTLIKNLSNG